MLSGQTRELGRSRREKEGRYICPLHFGEGGRRRRRHRRRSRFLLLCGRRLPFRHGGGGDGAAARGAELPSRLAARGASDPDRALPLSGRVGPAPRCRTNSITMQSWSSSREASPSHASARPTGHCQCHPSALAAVSFFLAPLFDLDSMIPGGRTPAPRPAQRPPRHGRSAPLRPSRSPPRAGAASPSSSAAARARVCLCTQPILLAVLFEVLCAQQALRSSAAELRLLQQRRRRRRRRPPALPPPTPSPPPPAPRPTVIPI